LGDRHQLAVLSRQRDQSRKILREQRWRARGEMAVARGEIDALRSELEYVYALNEKMLQSTSWKVTRPLRQAAALRVRRSPKPA
jgi:hypothetical protein